MDITFDPSTMWDTYLETSWTPDLWGSSSFVNSYSAWFEVLQGSTSIIRSIDYLDDVSFPDCCSYIEPGWYSFSQAAFDIPNAQTLDPGDYTMRFAIGPYAHEENFNVPVER